MTAFDTCQCGRVKPWFSEKCRVCNTPPTKRGEQSRFARYWGCSKGVFKTVDFRQVRSMDEDARALFLRQLAGPRAKADIRAARKWKAETHAREVLQVYGTARCFGSKKLGGFWIEVGGKRVSGVWNARHKAWGSARERLVAGGFCDT